MMARRTTTLTLLTVLLTGCSSTPSWFGQEKETVLDSHQQTVAAGDDALKRSVENREGDGTTELDESIEPSLKLTAEQARDRLDSGEVADGEAAEEERDLWNRIRAGFAMNHDQGDERVQQQLAWFQKHPSYINRVVERGRRYLHYIVEETERRGLPMEYALLPVVESAFDPFAYSHGRASGLWQFIPGTGRHFGLDQSWWHDGRRDVVGSTNAALTYLDQLAKRFDGDPTLALAAYNSGGGTVNSAIRRNNRKGEPTDYWSLDLPRETRHYVPKLIALAKIFDDPEAYGIELPPLEDEPYFEIVETGGQIDLAHAAELAGVDVDEIYLLNPSYNRWATRPDGPHRLLVPVASANRFRQGIASLDPDTRVSWNSYEVRSGDNLGAIARRNGTTASVLREVNKLNGDLIRVGQQLLIPSARADQGTYSHSQNQRLARKQEQAGRNSDGQRVSHLVKRGDTFWDIAREHGVSVRQVAAWNGMAPGDPLVPGRKLVIWSKNAQAAAGTQVASNNRSGMVRKVGYRVRQGDSLSTIANRFAVNVSDIAAWNDLNTARYLQPGQSLVLYVDVRNSP
ncbi:lytic transglycosylase [Marinobacter zhanjiangensis]|uniref:Lytic transglycosylase n=1 Tax=Marinobacter zhanjiangensis TaxID=578215 RepID=A0ABQ3B6J4_9GAMM|nr:LysM peptidoglycan-binding domain-containing protein [Marinobacter zhanjiangensis]GGY82201.1 lytic transglycosylase [Marinobacter zhanjiangensis]